MCFFFQFMNSSGRFWKFKKEMIHKGAIRALVIYDLFLVFILDYGGRIYAQKMELKEIEHLGVIIICITVHRLKVYLVFTILNVLLMQHKINILFNWSTNVFF